MRGLQKSGDSTQAFDISIFEIDNEKQMINLTKIAKSFKKRIDVWLKSQSTQDFISEFSNLTPNGGSCIETINGSGTWACREVALEFAQWISPKFKVFCIKKLDELFQTGKTTLQQQKLPSTKELALLVLQAEEEKERLLMQTKAQEEQLQLQAPKVEFVDKVLDSKSTYTTNQVASELGLSAIALNLALHNMGIQYKQSGTWILYDKYKSMELTKTRTFSYTGTAGEQRTGINTVWTEKGRLFIHERLNKELKKNNTLFQLSINN